MGSRIEIEVETDDVLSEISEKEVVAFYGDTLLGYFTPDDLLEHLSLFHEKALVAMAAENLESEVLGAIGEKAVREHFGLID